MHRVREVPEVTRGVCVQVQLSVTNTWVCTWGWCDVEALQCEMMGWGCSGIQLPLEHLQGGGAASPVPSWSQGHHSMAEM